MKLEAKWGYAGVVLVRHSALRAKGKCDIEFEYTD